MEYKILESSSAWDIIFFNSDSAIFPSSFSMSKTAQHSKTEALAMVKKFLLSLGENLPLPSAMLSGTLNDALPSWSMTYFSSLPSRITFLQAM